MANTLSICIVDDAADYRLLLQHMFNHRFPKYSVSFFADGKIFLDHLSGLKQLPNLILLDRHMPTLDGHQTLLRLKKHPRYKLIPVVMMSADASIEEVNNCYEAGVNSFLHKPIDFNHSTQQLDIICQYWLEVNRSPIEVI